MGQAGIFRRGSAVGGADGEGRSAGGACGAGSVGELSGRHRDGGADPEAEKKSRAGRKPFDAILMLRMLILQSLYNLSDEQIEYQVRDRMSFTRFLGLAFEDDIPDGTTLWLFREGAKGLSDMTDRSGAAHAGHSTG